jgi:heme A synthase
MALGALIGARYAATACPFLPGCIDASWPAPAGWSALNPFTRVAAAASMGDDGGVALHLLHRYCAVATVLLLGFGGLRALAQPATRPSAALLLALLLVQFALGVMTVLADSVSASRSPTASAPRRCWRPACSCWFEPGPPDAPCVLARAAMALMFER